MSGTIRRRVTIVAVAAFCSAMTVHAYPLVHPGLFDDDFGIIAQSFTGAAAWENLWRPWNDHAMPLGRLSTWVLVLLAGRPTALPFAAALQGPLALLAGMWLVQVFVSREMGHPFYGLLAMIVFGVSLKFNEAVFWFAASFALLALDTTLLALLAAQRCRQSGKKRWLILSVIWSALAPGWFASGVLAGPLCALYLLAPRGTGSAPHRRRRIGDVTPLLGTGIFLAMSFGLGGRFRTHADHYGGRGFWEVFDPVGGVALTGRIVVDNLVFGFNSLGRTCPSPLVLVLLAALGIAAWLWWRRVPAPGASSHRLMILGIALLFFGFWLAYSFRTAWPYETMMVRWTRYNLFPFLGIVLFAVGGLPGRQGTLFSLVPGRLTGKQIGALTALALLFAVLQAPQAIAGHVARNQDPHAQWMVLKQIEDMDARCRELGVAAITARQVLQPVRIPLSGDPQPRIDGWELLRGSDAPRPWTAKQVRSLLVPSSDSVLVSQVSSAPR